MQKLSLKYRGSGRANLILEAVMVLPLLVSVALLGCQKAPDQASKTADPAEQVAAQSDSTPSTETRLPRLVDLGAGKCIPCKLMAPILEELKQQYTGALDVEFIDVWQDSSAGEKYGVQMIPTQIFYDASGKELFRHVGFFAKEDILAKWKELGIELPATSSEPLPKT